MAHGNNGQPIGRQPGRSERVVNVKSRFEELAREDEEVSRTLFAQGHPRHAIYFCFQAMEKLVRGKIFGRVNAYERMYQDLNRTHSIEGALVFLIDVYSSNAAERPHLVEQFRLGIMGDLDLRHLHNDLRYPFFDVNRQHFRSRIYTQGDAEQILRCLDALKKFLRDMDQHIR